MSVFIVVEAFISTSTFPPVCPIISTSVVGIEFISILRFSML